MSDRALEEIAAARKWDRRDVARLIDNAHACWTARQLIENVEDVRRRFPAMYDSQVAVCLYEEATTYARDIARYATSMIEQKGADPGRTADTAVELWRALGELIHRVPDRCDP